MVGVPIEVTSRSRSADAGHLRDIGGAGATRRRFDSRLVLGRAGSPARAARGWGARGAGRRGRPSTPGTGRGRRAGTRRSSRAGSTGFGPGTSRWTGPPRPARLRPPARPATGPRPGRTTQPVERARSPPPGVRDRSRRRPALGVVDDERIGVRPGSPRRRGRPGGTRPSRRARARRAAPGSAAAHARAPGCGSSAARTRPSRYRLTTAGVMPARDVERQRPRIVGGERRRARRALEQRREQRPPDPLAQPVGLDEQVAQLRGDRPVSTTAPNATTPPSTLATSARWWSTRWRTYGPMMSTRRLDRRRRCRVRARIRADRRDVVDGRGPDLRRGRRSGARPARGPRP